ncbi:MAG: prepilin-type N-terminal cleavage/methylation domain-containing protein [Candidatus Saccharibacteria bacterium]|jgi:prepilin-type N-terminal cleavage/methylation domain-containing protein
MIKQRFRQYRASRSGLTLVEILFSLAIITTVVTLAYGSALSAWKSAVSANQRTQAQYLLQMSIENIRAYRDRADLANPWVTLLSEPNFKSPSGFAMKCDNLPTTCTWQIDTAPATWQAAGSQVNLSDATAYLVTVKPVWAWTTDPVTGLKSEGDYSPATQPDRIDAISFIAEVTYQDAKGISSSAKVSTIISGRQD